jgi:hypothetical protein
MLTALDRPALWVLAVLLYGVGDSVTTAAGFRNAGEAELGPVAAVVLEQAGVPAFLALKSLFLVACFGAWSLLSTPGRVAIPLALALVGGVVTVWNILVLSM